MRYVLAIPFIFAGAVVGALLSPIWFGVRCGIAMSDRFFDFPKD